jgi:hypothetical protein
MSMAERFLSLCRCQVTDKTVATKLPDPASVTDHLTPDGKHKQKKRRRTVNPNQSWSFDQVHANDLLPRPQSTPVVEKVKKYWWEEKD